MSQQSGYYSWVCFIDAQKGAWFGPISYDAIDDYSAGFAIDDNIKSWTLFAYYDNKPTDQLTCNFATRKLVVTKAPPVPKSVTFSECVVPEPDSKVPKPLDDDGSASLSGTARLLLYNHTDARLFATLSEHEGRQEIIRGRPNWAQWRFRNEYPDHTYLIKVFEENTVILRIDIRPVGWDIHIEILENSQGYYYRFNEPW